MPLRNADKFRLAIEAVNRNDIEGALRHVDPQVEWRAPAVLPDTQIYYGHDGVRAWRATMDDAFEEVRLEPQGEFRELDDIHVVVPIRAFLRGRESGIDVDVSFYMLGTGSELLERMEFFPAEEDAISAAQAQDVVDTVQSDR